MQKFVLRSALRPNQISFSHDQDPKAGIRTVTGLQSSMGTVVALKTLDRARVKVWYHSYLHCMTPSGGSHGNPHPAARFHYYTRQRGGLAASGGARSSQRYRWLEFVEGERQ